MMQDVVEDIAEFVPMAKTAKGLYDLLFSKGELDESKFFHSTHSDILFALFEYVQYQLSDVPMIVNFENIQGVDERSLELICSLLTSTKCLYLLEYTEHDASGYSFSELVTRFEETPSLLSSLFIKALNIHDVRRIIESQPNVSWDFIQNSYINWNGNIRLLVDVLARHRYSMPLQIEQKSINLLDATRAHLNSLAVNDLFLLIAIEVHKEPVQRSLLQKIVNYQEAFQYIIDIDGALETLDRHYLVKFAGDEIMLAHDSIRVSLNELGRYTLLSIVGQKFWLDTYQTLFENGDLYSSRGWQLTKVLYFASLLNYTDKIFSLLDVISDEAGKSRDPGKLILFVEDVKTSLVEKGKDQYGSRIKTLCYWLTEAWYNIGFSKKAWLQLDQIEEKSFKKNVLTAVLLEQIGRHKDAIEFSSTQIKASGNGHASYELALRLVRLITNYSLGNLEKTKEEFYLLYENERFVDCFEYGFLLRNAELIFSYQDSLPYYVKSINHFSRFLAIRQVSYSRITYGVHLGLTGRIAEARRQFNIAAEQLGNVMAERHSILNNLAVLSLFEKDISADTEVLFRQALLTADSDFEKVAIYNNYLVLLDWQERNDEAEMAIISITRILAKPSFASKEIIRYAYFNIHKYYQRLGHLDRAIQFRKMADGVGLEVTPIWRFWLYKETMPQEDEEVFLAVIDRPISFLCNWNMEFDSKLMHYE